MYLLVPTVAFAGQPVEVPVHAALRPRATAAQEQEDKRQRGIRLNHGAKVMRDDCTIRA